MSEDVRENLTNEEIFLLAAQMLDLASDYFSNHSANDLQDGVLNLIKNKEALCQQMRVWNTGEKEDLLSTEEWPQEVEEIGDSSLMRFLCSKLKEIAGSS